jgi:hypothetical protein
MITKLYGLIFYFLTCAMKWYQSRSIKKALDSFNESFRDSFKNTLDEIDVLKASIFHKASYKSQAQVQRIGAINVEVLNRIGNLDATMFDVIRWIQEKDRKEQDERVKQRTQFITGAELEERFSRLAGQLVMRVLEANSQADDHKKTDSMNQVQKTIVRRPTFSDTTQKKIKGPKASGCKQSSNKNTCRIC